MCTSHTTFSTDSHEEMGAQPLPKWIKEKIPKPLFILLLKNGMFEIDYFFLIVCLKLFYFHSILH